MGEFTHTIDSKGRLIIPAGFRGRLGARSIVTRGLDGCLFGYPLNEWAILERELKALPLTKRDMHVFIRFLYSAATGCEIDKQERINIPITLRTHASLEKKCVIVDVSSRLEAWSVERWNKLTSEAADNFNGIAENFNIDF